MTNLGYYCFFGFLCIMGIIFTVKYYSFPEAQASYFIIKENQINTTNTYTVLKVENLNKQTIVTVSSVGLRYSWFHPEQVTIYNQIKMNMTKIFNLADNIEIKKVQSIPVCGIQIFYPNGTSIKQSADLQYSGNFRLNYTNSAQLICVEKDKNLFNENEVMVN